MVRKSSRDQMSTYQVPEMLFNHQLKSLGCARGVPSNHGILGHDLGDKSSPRIQALGSDLMIMLLVS